MDYEKEIPFGAFDSELMYQEIYIPEGFKATIKGNRIILKKTESEDEKIRKELVEFVDINTLSIDERHDRWIAWLEKQSSSSVKWQKNTPDNKPAINHSVLMKTTQGIAEGYFVGSLWFQFRWSSNIKDSDVLAWIELSELEKQGEPKPTEWSKEDENRFQNIIACIEDCYNEKDAQDLIRWFKSIRHQPKQVWSKADIKMLELIIDGYQNTEDFSKVDGVFVDWLKSLKDRMEGKEEKQ